MESSRTIYQVYCSTCNKEQKKKMSWTRYIRYITFDGKTKGYHDIDASYIANEPSVCPFGHKINVNRTKMISEPEINRDK